MKRALNLEEQIALMRDRGLEIDNEPYARAMLTNITYYRLSGYFRPFQVAPGDGGDDSFQAGAAFEKVARVYKFDSELRDIVSNALAQFELVFRSRLTNMLAMNLGPVGHLNDANYKDYTQFVDLLNRMDTDIDRSKEVFIKHHKAKYPGEDVPVWKAMETLSFGLVSKLFSELKEPRYAIRVATVWEINGARFKSVVEHLSYLRNLCAHHGRLWNRDMVKKMPELQSSPVSVVRAWEGSTNARIYQSLVMLNHLVTKIDPDSQFESRITHLMAEHEDLAGRMGYPDEHDLIHL